MRTISVPAQECWRPVVGFETTYEVSMVVCVVLHQHRVSMLVEYSKALV